MADSAPLLLRLLADDLAQHVSQVHGEFCSGELPACTKFGGHGASLELIDRARDLADELEGKEPHPHG